MQPSIENLNGHWVLDKTLSDDLDPVLKLQDISWVLRKIISRATITLTFTQSMEGDVERLDMAQTATGGIPGTTERRVFDWKPRAHKDYIFGDVGQRSRYICGSPRTEGRVRPDVEVQTTVDDPQITRFLRGEIDAKGNEVSELLLEDLTSDKYENEKELWIHTVAHEVKNAWTAEQIWGVETLDCERCFTRRIVVCSSAGDYKLCRLVYKFEGKD